MNLRHRPHEHGLHRSAEEHEAQHHDVEDPTPRQRSTTRPVQTRKRKGSKGQIDALEYVKRFLILFSLVSLLCGAFMLYRLVLHPRFVHPPKVKVLSPDFQVSVVLMNHYRPRMIKESSLLSTLLNHPHVGQVLLCHSNALTKFHMEHPKVQNLDAIAANKERGLSLRFLFCYTAAKYDQVIIVDDDQEITSHALDTLLRTFAAHPNRIVGRYGRNLDSPRNHPNHGYNTRTVFGKVEVVLTKLLIAPRTYCGNFLRYESLVQDFLPQSKPLWNGEDIFFNLVANHVNRVPSSGPYRNLAVYFGGVWEASNDLKDDDAGKHDISGNMDRHAWYQAVWSHELWANYTFAAERARNHTAYRGMLWSTTKARLAQLTAQDEERLAQQFAEKYGSSLGQPGTQDL